MKEVTLVEKFSLSPEEYAQLFFYDNSFSRKYFEIRGLKEIEITNWMPAPEGRKQRVISYITPISNNPVIVKIAGGLDTQVREVQLLHTLEDGSVSMIFSTSFPQSKLGESLDFRVIWLVETDNSDPSRPWSCRSTISIRSDYKGLLFKGSIENFAADMASSSFSQWHALCKERVKEFVREQSDLSSPPTSSSENSEDENFEIEIEKKDSFFPERTSRLSSLRGSSHEDSDADEFFDVDAEPSYSNDEVETNSTLSENTRLNKVVDCEEEKVERSNSLRGKNDSRRKLKRTSCADDLEKEVYLIRHEVTQLKSLLQSFTPTMEAVITSVVEKSLQSTYHRNAEPTHQSSSNSNVQISHSFPSSSSSSSPQITSNHSSISIPSNNTVETEKSPIIKKRTSNSNISSASSFSSSRSPSKLLDVSDKYSKCRLETKKNDLALLSNNYFQIFLVLWPFVTYPFVRTIYKWIGNISSYISSYSPSENTYAIFGWSILAVPAWLFYKFVSKKGKEKKN